MKKRVLPLLLCLLLTVQMLCPAAQADQKVYFVAAGSTVQPLSDSTMPFWHNGYLYIPGNIFTGMVRQTLGVTFTYVESENTAILYQDNNNRFLVFNLGLSYTVDGEGQYSYPGGVMRNGQVFIPAYLAARYFDLVYSVTEVKQGYLVWLRQKDFGLTEAEFADAASYTIARYYQTYLKNKGGTDTPAVPVPETPELSGRRVFLCLAAGEETAAQLDALARYDAQAAFFCDAEFLEQQGGLLRRMTATGQSVGLTVDGANTEKTVLEQAAAGNLALERATCGATRLVRLENGTAQQADELAAAGYRCLDEDLDRSGYSLHSRTQAQNLQQRISSRRGGVTVWLGSSASAAGLRAFLTLSETVENRCLAWTETT